MSIKWKRRSTIEGRALHHQKWHLNPSTSHTMMWYMYIPYTRVCTHTQQQRETTICGGVSCIIWTSTIGTRNEHLVKITSQAWSCVPSASFLLSLSRSKTQASHIYSSGRTSPLRRHDLVCSDLVKSSTWAYACYIICKHRFHSTKHHHSTPFTISLV